MRSWWRYRWAEFIGLFLVSLIYLVGWLTIEKVQGLQESWLSFLIWPILLTIAHLLLKIKLPTANQVLFPCVAFLTSISLLTLKSLGGRWFSLQINWLAIALIAMLIVVFWLKEPYRLINYKYLFGVSALIFLLAPAIIGVEQGGSRLWLNLFGYSFQPAELAKIFLVIFIAAYLAEKREVLTRGHKRFLGLFWPAFRHFGPVLVMWSLSLLILVFERDLGSSLLFLSLFLTLIYIATGRLAYVFVGSILFFLGAGVTYYLFSHVKTRIDVWLQPLPADVSGSVYQIAQSLFALAAGNLSGTGLSRGLLGRQIFMPAAQTDFILAVTGEELGFIVTAALIITYLAIATISFKAAREQKNDFLTILLIGLASVILLQTFIIIAGSLKFIPLTGLTLPYISYGGSSLLANFIIAGLMLVLSVPKK